MGNIQTGDKQTKTGKSPGKSKNFIKNLNRKSPARESKKSKKGERKQSLNEKPLDVTPNSDNIEVRRIISDDNAIENIFKTVERECSREAGAADVSEAAAGEVTGPTCRLRPSCLAARSTNREQTPEYCVDGDGALHHASPEPPPPGYRRRSGDNAGRRTSVDRGSDKSDNKRKNTPTKDSSSDSVFTDPLTPVAFSAEINQCYYSAESDSTLGDAEGRGEPRGASDGAAHAAAAAAMPQHAADRDGERQSPNKFEEKKEADVIDDSSSAAKDDDTIMGSLLASSASNSSEGAELDASQHECSHDFVENRLKASPGQTSFTLSRHRKVELPPTKLKEAVLIDRNEITEKDHRRHSSLNDGGVGVESNVLRKVASLTLEQATAAEPRAAAAAAAAGRPKFVPEKLDFQMYEKFEGQMLVNWFASSVSENSHMKSLLSVQDLRTLGGQYCSHLLAAGVLRQIPDKDAPADETFRPDMMYLWSHTETPTVQPVTPGRIQMLKWQPNFESAKKSKNIVECATKKDNHEQPQVENENCKLFDADEACLNVQDAKQIIFKLKHQCQMLQLELEKYKTLSQIQTLTQNAQDDFVNLPTQNAQDDFVNPPKSEDEKQIIQEKNSLRSKLSPKASNTEEPLNNKLTNKAVINIPESISDNVDIIKNVQSVVISRDSFKHDNSIIKSKSISEYSTQFKSNLKESDGTRSEEIENFCKLNKSLQQMNNGVDNSFKKTVDIFASESVRANHKKDDNSVFNKSQQTISSYILNDSNDNHSSLVKRTEMTNVYNVNQCTNFQENILSSRTKTQKSQMTHCSEESETINENVSALNQELMSKEHLTSLNKEEPILQTDEEKLLIQPRAKEISPEASQISLLGVGPPPPPMPVMTPAPPPMPGLGPPPPPMPSMGPPSLPMPVITPQPPSIPGTRPPPPLVPGMGPPPPPMPGMGPPPPPMPGMGPPPPPMPGMGPPPPPMPGMGPPLPPMPGMGPPPPPMPGIGPPPPPMPGMGPPPPQMPGMGPPPPPIPGMELSAASSGGIPPPPMLGASNCNPVPPTGIGPPPPPMSGPIPFPAPPVGGWNPQRATLRKTPVVPSVPMKPLYWTRILAPPQVVQESPETTTVKPLWVEIEEDRLDNIDEFADLFSRQVITKKPVNKKKHENKTKIQPVKILDSKRSQNVGILAQSLHVEFSEIENAIYNFDTSVVSLEALHQIYELRATDEELTLIKCHLQQKSEIPLDKPEAFLHDLSGIPNFAERISCFMFQAEFEDSICTIMHKLDNLKHTCEFLMSNEGLKKVFAIILTLGNYMNGGNGQRGQADGFGLEILSKLRDVKSKESTVTLLHFIVRTYARRRGGALAEECAMPVPEPGDVARAAAIDFPDAHAHLAHLAAQLQECREKMKKVVDTEEETSPTDSFDDNSKKRSAVFKEKMASFLEVADEKLKTENENLEECQNKFIATVRFYQYIPRSGKIEDCEPKDFFALWLPFCTDFKDIFKKEQQFALKEKLKETKKRKEEIKATAQPKKEGGLKARMQRLAKK